MNVFLKHTLTIVCGTLLLNSLACESGCIPAKVVDDHGEIAKNIFAPQGEVVPYASAEQKETFKRGLKVAKHRFTKEEGLGPAFNVTFCGACHEKPVFGGSAGLYRNFSIAGLTTQAGAFIGTNSAGRSSGVVRIYDHRIDAPARPKLQNNINTVARRNPIPIFGVGLLAEIPEQEILQYADPNDKDGDGISGRPNFDRGFVGRFGVKSQTVSIEGFIRGPFFNHMGITSNPLEDEVRATLPINSSATAMLQPPSWTESLLKTAQAAAPNGPLRDRDAAPDPELAPKELFDLVSFAMLLAPAPFEELTDETRQGLKTFDAIQCAKCHVPRLHGPRGAIPVYSDLLLHDMGPDLDDGIVAGAARGSEFRTQPLWGVSSVGPYLHDGRAHTLKDAILAHGGEAENSKLLFSQLTAKKQEQLIEFLMSLGGRDQSTQGLLLPEEKAPEVGENGGPHKALNTNEEALFNAGRKLFDREFGFSEGIGSPRFNGDSCRACHFEPVLGGAGPRGVNVMRHGILNQDMSFAVPAVGTIIHRSNAETHLLNRVQKGTAIYEPRQTPSLLGLGLVEQIAEADILANADPFDHDGDGISGKASIADGGRLGRFGWKAQIPSLEEFIRDAVTAELGMTMPIQEGLTFGRVQDNDQIPDPEFSLENAKILLNFLQQLGAPKVLKTDDQNKYIAGQQIFDNISCAKCHIPSFDAGEQKVNLYSDLLLHQLLEDGALGIEDASATVLEFRTAPLWGVVDTAPYMHDGFADSLETAILRHKGEAKASSLEFEALSEEDKETLIYFLERI